MSSRLFKDVYKHHINSISLEPNEESAICNTQRFIDNIYVILRISDHSGASERIVPTRGKKEDIYFLFNHIPLQLFELKRYQKNDQTLYFERKINTIYRRTRKEEDYAKYKEALNAAKIEIRQPKRRYEQKLAYNIKNDSKRFYAYVRSKQNVQDKVGPLEDSADNIISQGFLMAEDLNGYFSSVFTKEDISSLPVADAKFQGAKSDYLGPLVVTPELVAKKIKAMKDNKSPGVDGIPPKLLMETVEQISIPLARVFNLSLKEAVVPFEWKEANIIPLFKKGSRNKSENYRPVSLTSVICKLLERLIKDHMVDFLVTHKLLNSSQH